jgi:ligand-binding sensor domain-containing protein
MPAASIAILFIIFLFNSTIVRAVDSEFKPQEERLNYGLDFWSEAEGLPQSRIRAIIQTRDGYLWLGTDSGLVRFNGTSFTAFTIETGSLKDNEVSALLEDDDGGLWIGAYGGGLTLLKQGRFRTFTTSDGLPDDVVKKLAKDQAGNIWMATPHGACRYSHGIFTKFTTSEGLSDNFVTSICADSSRGVFVSTVGGLHRFTNEKFELVKGIAEEGDGRIDHLLSGRDGSLWIGFHEAVVKQ